MIGEHGTLRHTMDKATDMLGGLMGRAKARSADAHSADSFVENAAIGNRYEVEAARVALQRSRSEPIRMAARRMIVDHTAMAHQLQSALRMSETSTVPSPPAGLDTRRSKLVEHLEAAPDNAFDKAYLDQQVLAHKENHGLLAGYAMNGDNAQLRSLAASAEPVVHRHLAMLEALQADHRD